MLEYEKRRYSIFGFCRIESDCGYYCFCQWRSLCSRKQVLSDPFAGSNRRTSILFWQQKRQI
ncbi:MAG: hypothetical protein IJ680_02435 [Paludibacteraceae bacterium]|nr:hypothetical protein [Paludibacteraceae bacterium]